MTGARRLRILEWIASAPGASASERLCAVGAEATATTGAGIMLLMSGLPGGSLYTTDAVSARLEELQFTSGEGPCVEAFHRQRTIDEPDLLAPAELRWPSFSPAAVDAGARAVFGFPIAIGSANLGALNLYRDEVGSLTAEQHADALVIADLAARSVLGMQAGAPPGQLGADLTSDFNFRFVVHQATGVVAFQLGVSVTDALMLLRAHAFLHDRVITEVAHAVVDGRLHIPAPVERPGA